MMANGNMPTLGSEWRRARQEGEVIRLPSGNHVRLGPVALDRLILSGQLPDILTPMAAKVLWYGAESSIAESHDRVEQIKGYAELVNVIVPAAMLEPRIVDNPQADDEIGIEDLDFNDKTTIFHLVISGVEALRKFRQQQAANVEPIPDSQDDGEPAEQSGGDS